MVPVSSINAITRQTLAYARSISDSVSAVHISDDEAEIEHMRSTWSSLGTDVPLVIIESPYRSLVGPLLSYLDELHKQVPRHHAHGGAAGVCAAPLVGADSAQPDRRITAAALPAGHDCDQRAVSP